MNNFDWALYSKGKYWLYEHWNEQRTNIYGKAKYNSFDELKVSFKNILSEDQLTQIESNKQMIIEQKDGTALFFKYVDL